MSKKLKAIKLNKVRAVFSANLPWRPSLMFAQDLSSLLTHNESISTQLKGVLKRGFNSEGGIYLVTVRMEVGRGEGAALTTGHFEFMANWLRRNSRPIKKLGGSFGAGCIIPTLQTWGVVFNPFMQLDLKLLVHVPGLPAAQAVEQLRRAFDAEAVPLPSWKAVEGALAAMVRATEAPTMMLDPKLKTRSDYPEHHLAALDATTKNMRDTVHAVGVRHLWVYFGMRCGGSRLNLLPPRQRPVEPPQILGD